MSYRIAGKADGVIGGAYRTEAEARASIDQIVADGIENETNWLMELAHSTTDGGSANIDDDVYVQRILAAAAADRRAIAAACARERMYADYTVVASNEE